jgi:hypothetical protein
MANQCGKTRRVAGRAIWAVIIGMAGLVTWALCFMAIVGSAVQTGRGTVLPREVVLLQWVAWLLELPWIWLIWLLMLFLRIDAWSATGPIAILLASVWSVVLCWGLSRLLRWSDRRRAARLAGAGGAE